MFGAPKDLSRRQVIQATLIGGVWVAFRPVLSLAQAVQPSDLTPAQSGVDYSKTLASPDWKPAFFSDQQNETLISFSDLLIPKTETPGAKEALCNRSIDAVLAAEPSEAQQQFLKDLASLDESSQKEYGKEFRALSPDEQNELLRPLAYTPRQRNWGEDIALDPRREQFEHLKYRVVYAYYSSEIGQRELGWDGAYTHGPYTGCPHAAGTHK
jgi:hypothetical protein